MYKNILIMGPGRAGKTTLSKMINKKYGYSIISIDDIVTSLEEFPEIDISWDKSHEYNRKRLSRFLIKYLKELSDGNKFYDGYKSVIEGTDIDFDTVMPEINLDKTLLIGLTYNNITREELFNNVKKYDTEDDWSYYLNDEELNMYCESCISINEYFDEMFKKYNIISFDTSFDRERVLTYIVDNLEGLEHGTKDTDKM